MLLPLPGFFRGNDRRQGEVAFGRAELVGGAGQPKQPQLLEGGAGGHLYWTGPGWSLTNSPNLTPPGYYYLVAVDARDVPSQAKIIKVT